MSNNNNGIGFPIKTHGDCEYAHTHFTDNNWFTMNNLYVYWSVCGQDKYIVSCEM